MELSSSELKVKIKEKILGNFFGYVKLFTPIQSNFLTDIYKRYHCLDSGSIVLFFAKKTHQAILRKKEYDLNYDLSFEKFWHNQKESNIENSTIIEIAEKTHLPKETARRKLAELTRQKVLRKIKQKIIWLPTDEYKKTYNEVVNNEIKQIAKLTKYVASMVNLNISAEEIINEYKKKFSFYWFHYLDLQLQWIRLWKLQLNDLEVVLIFMHIATLLVSKVDNEVSHKTLFSEPSVIKKPQLKNINVSISATSLSDITGMPRATCIRKLNKMVEQKLITKDINTKRYFIIPEAFKKSLISKELTEKITGLVSEYYLIMIKALSSKTSY
ncbi:hypothetical protein N9J56_01260 [Pelagibacteraceae bacterium]|nr:hypothetical protein [Pelagibacteraceae bacterium]